MTKRLVLLMCAFAFSLLFAASNNVFAQTSRTAVGAAEVNGTFQRCFAGKFKGNCDEIKILALGKGKLKVSFDLLYPHLDADGKPTANMGSADGEAAIDGDTAIYHSSEYGECTITIKFVKTGQIKVTQNGTDSNCGFGFNVTADGTYKKTSSAKPKF